MMKGSMEKWSQMANAMHTLCMNPFLKMVGFQEMCTRMAGKTATQWMHQAQDNFQHSMQAAQQLCTAPTMQDRWNQQSHTWQHMAEQWSQNATSNMQWGMQCLQEMSQWMQKNMEPQCMAEANSCQNTGESSKKK